ncbi:hypothetical protein [Rhodovulum sp.]|uniref:hypothetical protein n=1 Tax=Rhodovulum sp. TaxID=34009 RepID=UPI0017D33E89|nr:hypothetical protein [Rhodovulum sp.]HDR28950.1 hypothetical protein [Rhodovulum sp.]
MLPLLGIYLCVSLVLPFGAAEPERRAIVARRLGPNGRAVLIALFASAIASLGVTVAAGLIGNWVDMLHVLGGAILYHAIMGVSLVHGLQKVSAGVATGAMS